VLTFKRTEKLRYFTNIEGFMIENSDGSRRCPYCGEEININAIVCRFCNRPLPGHENEIPPQISQADNHPKKQSTSRILLIILAVVLIFAIIVGTFYLLGGKKLLVKVEPCYVQSSEFATKLQTYFDDWDDANSVAGSTSRIALSGPLMQLQTIRREVSDMVAPNCSAGVQLMMINYMDKVIDSYLAFMSQESDSVVTQKMQDANKLMNVFVVEFTKLKNGESPYNK
jgi:hypothetical protein